MDESTLLSFFFSEGENFPFYIVRYSYFFFGGKRFKICSFKRFRRRGLVFTFAGGATNGFNSSFFLLLIFFSSSSFLFQLSRLINKIKNQNILSTIFFLYFQELN